MAQSDHIERKVSAEDFYKAFADQWSEELSGRLGACRIYRRSW